MVHDKISGRTKANHSLCLYFVNLILLIWFEMFRLRARLCYYQEQCNSERNRLFLVITHNGQLRRKRRKSTYRFSYRSTRLSEVWHAACYVLENKLVSQPRSDELLGFFPDTKLIILSPSWRLMMSEEKIRKFRDSRKKRDYHSWRWILKNPKTNWHVASVYYCYYTRSSEKQSLYNYNSVIMCILFLTC